MPKVTTIRERVHQPWRDTVVAVRLSFREKWKITLHVAGGMLVPMPLIVATGALGIWHVGLLVVLAIVAYLERRWAWDSRLAFKRLMTNTIVRP